MPFNDLCAITTISKIFLKVKQIVRNFKNTLILHSTFKNIKNKIYGKTSVTTLKLPSNTRWAGSILMMKSVKKNQQALKETSVAVGLEKAIDKEVNLESLSTWNFCTNWKTIKQKFKNVVSNLEYLKVSKEN